jgi:hypothetical protein
LKFVWKENIKTVLSFKQNIMKALTTIFFFFAVAICTISYTNAYSFGKIATADQDTLSKKGIALMGKQEVPPVAQSGYGTLDVAYDRGTKTLTYVANWYGLSDSAMMMHFHGPADTGQNAPVIYPIPDFPHTSTGTVTGTVKLDEVKLKEADLLAGKWYYNIHTKKNPAGEIRGQVIFSTR